ncbi:hypothetical protein PG990_005623 [Apiospora arundinis]|uniref:Uncharacterized protein n=1 Tax=Apiospora arundinis TaxID=335852 RepID=A0ABR2J7Z9_9PEZI
MHHPLMPELFTHIPPLDDFETPVSGSTAASLSGFRNRVIIPSPQCTPSIPTRKPGFTCDECQQSFDTKHKLRKQPQIKPQKAASLRISAVRKTVFQIKRPEAPSNQRS